MKKRFIIPFAVLASMMFTGSAFADGNPAMFGENIQRTHDNGIDDPLPWKQVANIDSLNYNGQSYPVNGNGTAVAQGNQLVFPVSAPNDDPTQYGFLGSWDFSSWQNGKPAQKWVQHTPGVSNSSPVIYNGNTYLAAGDTLYGYDANGNSLTFGGGENIYNSKATNAAESQADSELINQVVSHPLYVTASQMGRSDGRDLIWVSSQNGYLFALDSSTLTQIYAINIGSRMDASPALVKDTAGTPYIAVATAYSAANKGGTGTLYIIDPRTGTVVSNLANPAGNNSPVVTAPIATGTGYLMWNDYAGDVFFGRLNPDAFHSITKISEWDQVDGSGQTTNQEAGYSTQTGQYILPFSSDSMVVYVDPNTSGSTPIPVPISGKAVSSPAISKDYVYVGDDKGYVDQLMNVKGFAKEDAPYIGGTSGSVNGVQNLASVMESSLQSPVAGVGNIPTLAFAGNDGLHVWQSMGAIYSIGTDYTQTYTNGQVATFDPSKPITVTQVNSNLSASLEGIANEEIDISYSVDGSAPQYLTGFKVFNSDGSQVKSFQLPQSALSQIPTTWTDGKTHKVTFNVYANTNDAYGYAFDSVDSGNNQKLASTTVTFSTQQESIKLSPPSETVQSGTPVTLSYTVTGMQAGDKVKITPSGNGAEMWSSTGDTNATDSSTEIEFSTTNQIGVTYTAVVIDKNGNQVASDTTTIQWSPKKVAPPTNMNGGYGTITDGDIAVGFWDNDWSKTARPNKLNNFTITIKNTNDYSGPVKYTVNVSSPNPDFQPFTKEGVVYVDANSKALIQIPYTPVDWVDPHYGYNIYFQVSIEAIQPKSSDPNDPPPPALQDNVSSNDAATGPVDVPAPPRLSS